MTTFNIKILETQKEIEQEILKALRPQVDSLMQSAIRRLKVSIPEIVSKAIYESATFQSLSSGQLRLEFGISDAQAKVAGLLSIWIKNMQFQYEKPAVATKGIKSRLSINMIKSDFSDVLGSDYAEVYASKGYTLPWLKWLLLDGTANIVNAYDVFIGPNYRSRTGMAIMKKSVSGWSVPSEFAGTQNDNWITRAIEAASSDIETALMEAFS